MRQQQILRKLIPAFCFLSLLVLTLRRLEQDKLAGLAGFSKYVGHQHPVDPAACRIWPDWEASDPQSLTYDAYDNATARVPMLGDARVLGAPDQCLSASSRLGQYLSSALHKWDEVRWGAIQKRCVSSRRKLPPSQVSTDLMYDLWQQSPSSAITESPPLVKGRTAVVLRTWDDYAYSESRRAWLRALIAEAALHSGGDYEVFLLVNVKDDTIPLDDDREVYERALHTYVPEEFRDMALLYNRQKLEAWYPKVEEHGAQDQMYQALQIFSHQFPHFTHIWQLEMDLRTTGHIHTTLQSMAEFALTQPRRNLWERNGRFYIPELYNGSYEAFRTGVDAEIGEWGVWGPLYTTDFQPKGPVPPAQSRRNWGVHEEADLISLMPMVDPIDTDWVYETNIHGFADGTKTPRRAAFISITRSSRHLLQLISQAQREHGQWLVSEATLETFALLHGLKAVTVPHPISFANEMTLQEVDKNLHRGPPHAKAGGWAMSMSYTSSQGFVPGPWRQASYWFASDDAPNIWHAYLGGKCLPPMLLHPVKDE